MKIAQALYDQLVDHAQEEAPLECCGLIAVDDAGQAVRVLRARNAAESEFRYEVDGLEQMQLFEEIADAGLSLGAMYHSHTHAEAYPSEVDVAHAFYPDVLYVIVGLQDADWPEVCAFRIVEGKVSRVELQILRG